MGDRPLGDNPDLLSQSIQFLVLRKVMTKDNDVSLKGFENAAHYLKEGRLPRPIFAHNRDKFAGLDL